MMKKRIGFIRQGILVVCTLVVVPMGWTIDAAEVSIAVPNGQFQVGTHGYLKDGGCPPWDNENGRSFVCWDGNYWGSSYWLPDSPCHLESDPNNRDYYLCLNKAEVFQVINEVYQVNTTYTMNAYMAVGGSGEAALWRLEFYYEGEDLNGDKTREMLAFADNTTPHEPNMPPVVGDWLPKTWYPVTLSYTTTAPAVGKPIGIYLSGAGYESMVDCVTLTASSDIYCELIMQTNFSQTDSLVEPLTGTAHYYLGDERTVPIRARYAQVNCPDLYTFDHWAATGCVVADPLAEQTSVTLENTSLGTVEAVYVKTNPGCGQISQTVFNGDFELPRLAASSATLTTPGWSGDSLGIENEYPYALPTDKFVSYPDPVGVQHLVIYDDGKSALHEPGGTWQANGAYVLTVDLGRAHATTAHPEYNYDLWFVRLQAGTTILAEANQATNGMPDPNSWMTVTLNHNVNAMASYAGQPIRIVLGGDQGACFDNVTLVGPTIDVPQTLTLAATPGSTGDGLLPSTGNHYYSFGTNVALMATTPVLDDPDTFVFEQWNGVVADALANTTTTTMDKNRTVTAVYTVNNVCGDIFHPIAVADLDGDCLVSLNDFAELTKIWLAYGPVPFPNSDFECGYHLIIHPQAAPWTATSEFPVVLTGNKEYGAPYYMPQAACSNGTEYVYSYGRNVYALLDEVYGPVGTAYTLKVVIGTVPYVAGLIDFEETDYRIYLYYLNGSNAVQVAVANKSNTGIHPVNGEWTEVSLNYTVTAGAVGKRIGVFLGAIVPELTGSGLCFDCVRLTASNRSYDLSWLAEIMGEQWLEDTRP